MPRTHIIGGAAVLALTFLGMQSGCAFGRNELTGEIVGGVPLGKLADTANSALSAAGGLLPPPWGGIAELAIPALGLGALAHGRARAGVKVEADRAYEDGVAAANAARDAADRAYDEAKIREAYKRQPPPPDAGGGVPVS